MKSRFVLDTSFICSLLILDDINHQKAISVYEKLPKDSSFYTPATVMLEIITGMKRLGFRYLARVKNFLRDIDVDVIDIDDKFLKSYELYLRKRRIKLTAIDFSILVTSVIKKGKVLTFDKKLAKAV